VREIRLFPAEAGFNDPDALIKWEQWELSHDDEAGVLSTNFVPLIISLLVPLESSLILRKKKRKQREEVNRKERKK
jgi:hypothetical protein